MRVQPDMLSCEQARRTLWPLDRPREFVANEEDARAHMRGCDACRSFFAADVELSGVLARYGGGAKAPEALRMSILEAIASEERPSRTPGSAGRTAPARTGRPRSSPREFHARGALGIIAATVLVAAIPITVLIANDSNEPVEDIFVQDYLSRAAEENVLEYPDAASVSSFFMRELGVAVTPASVDDAKVTRAMVCLLRSRRAAMVEYRMGEHTIAHYMVPRDDRSIALTQLLTESQRGVQVAAWADREFEHALVSDLPEPELARLAGTAFAVR